MTEALPQSAPADAAAERVRALQAMIEAARRVADGGRLASSEEGQDATGTGFAQALQSASAEAYEPLQGTAVPAGAGAGEQYGALISAAAERNGVAPAVLHGLIEQESGFDASAQSSAGASGLTQLMPATAATLGVADPLDPAESIEGGARYLGELLRSFGGNLSDALAAYNAGPGAVEQYGGIPPYAETQQYVSNVLADAQAYASAHPEGAVSA